MTNIRAGLYCRLSVADAQGGESASIANQRAFLHAYAEAQGWRIVKVYADDGYSGGHFDRPSFRAMLADAAGGEINLILVKDLSRFGRSHIEVDRFLEDIFPALGVRFIAAADGYDSAEGSDFLPFRSFFNEYFLKDTSRKVKAARRARAYTPRLPAYGYIKEGTHLVIDEPAAETVRRVFRLRAVGASYAKIAAALNTAHIPPPHAHRRQNDSALWRDSAVRRMLQNEVYRGHTIALKTTSVSPKSKKRVQTREDERVRRENTHAAIVTRAEWNAAHSHDKPARAAKPRKASLFAGLLFCENGHPLCAGADTQTHGRAARRYRYYTCALHKQTGGAACAAHRISERILLRLLREDMVRRLAAMPPTAANHTQKTDAAMTVLYERRLRGGISPAEFAAAWQENETAQRAVSQQIYSHSAIRTYLAAEPARETLAAAVEKITVLKSTELYIAVTYRMTKLSIPLWQAK